MIDPLDLAGRAAWTHVDAAWAGPLRFSARHSGLLLGIEHADSVSISGHKWLFQPKESALVLFRDTLRAHCAISFGAAYLAAPNVGLLGSHGAAAIPLLALLWAWGRSGVEERLDRCMAFADRFADFVEDDPRLELLARPETRALWYGDLSIRRFAKCRRYFQPALPHKRSLPARPGFDASRPNPVLQIEQVIDAVKRAL